MYSLADRASLLAFGLVGLAGAVVAWALGEGLLALVGPPAPVVEPPARVAGAEPGVAPGPAPPPAFAPRLVRAGARSGDVQIVLIWNDVNDLDLHCVGPDGYDIYSANRGSESPTGGRLDIDANTACYAPEGPTEPVESIYWPAGAAPPGTYKVYVDAFERCPNGPDKTAYRCAILADGQWKEFEGTAAFPGRTGKVLVHEFVLQPRPGAGAPAHHADAPAEAAPVPAAPGAGVRAGWAGLIAAGVVFALTVGGNYRVGKRPLVSLLSGLVTVAAALLGAATGAFGQTVDRSLHTGGGPGVGFALAWLSLGGLLGAGVGLLFRVPRAELRYAALFGLLGGLVGTIGLFAGRLGGDWAGRFSAVAALGLGVGLSAARGESPAISATPRRLPPPLPPPVARPAIPPPVTPLPPRPVPKPPASPPVARPAPAPPVKPPTPPAAPKVPAPAPPAPVRPNAPVPPPAARPAVPPTPAKPALPAPAVPPIKPDACPYCRSAQGHPGPRGGRYCMIHDKTY